MTDLIPTSGEAKRRSVGEIGWGATRPCQYDGCGLSERNTVHKKRPQYGYHEYVAPSSPEPAEQVESRSFLRRKALMRGENMPTFEPTKPVAGDSHIVANDELLVGNRGEAARKLVLAKRALDAATFAEPVAGKTKLFRVKTPSGVLADGKWATREEIPTRIPDSFNCYFSPEDDGEIIEVDPVPAVAAPEGAPDEEFPTGLRLEPRPYEINEEALADPTDTHAAPEGEVKRAPNWLVDILTDAERRTEAISELKAMSTDELCTLLATPPTKPVSRAGMTAREFFNFIAYEADFGDDPELLKDIFKFADALVAHALAEKEKK